MKKLLWVLALMPFAFAFAQNNRVTVKAKSFSAEKKEVIIYTTADNTSYRLSPTDSVRFEHMGQPYETQNCVFVDPTKQFQTILGIGGALTDASAETFYKLPADKQQEILTAYYDPIKGIGYSLARTNIQSCDFSSDSYSYVQQGDKDLKTFNIDHDKKYRIPFIKKAIAAAGGKLTLFASPWSPPAFMKDNDDVSHGGKLLPAFYQSWANFYGKFINAYKKEGIPVWGITIQNEPMAKQTWESCMYTGEEERDFLKNYLGPTMQKNGLGDKKIIVWDHNRDMLYQRASSLLNDPEAAKYAWGVGFHWYEDWSGGDMEFDNVARVHESFPGKNLMLTEACTYPFKLQQLKEWRLGERYGRSMIHDFNNGAVGWTDWNILLDETGGPNHVGNFCFAPVHAMTQTGELVYTNAFYYIGHFSKFVRPGARRISVAPSRTTLQATGFVNKNGKVAVIVMNLTDQKINYILWISGDAAKLTILPHSMETLVF